MALPKFLRDKFLELDHDQIHMYAGLAFQLLGGHLRYKVDARENLSFIQFWLRTLALAQFAFSFKHRGRPGLPARKDQQQNGAIEVPLARALEYQKHFRWAHNMHLLYFNRDHSHQIAAQQVTVKFGNRWRVDNARTGEVSCVGYGYVDVIPEALEKAVAWAARKEERSKLATSLDAQRAYWEEKVFAGRTWPADLRMFIFLRDGFRCVICNRHRDELRVAGIALEVDHEQAVENGGETRVQNGRTTCRGCNLGKHLVKRFATSMQLAQTI